MDRYGKHALNFSLLAVCMCCLTGCYKSAHRIYSGPPLPANETVLVYAVGDTAIYDIREAKETGLKGLKRINLTSLVELLPGQYVAGIRYIVSSGGREYRGNRSQIDLTVQPGNIYVIYPDVTYLGENLTWRPVFANLNDYNKSDCSKNDRKRDGISHDCPDRDEIKNWAAKYLKSERLGMSYSKYKTPLIIPKSRYVEGYIIDGDWEK